MKKEELEKYIGELSPELQAKARQCKDMGELNALLAENDVELSEDALEAVAGGCSLSSDCYDQGDLTTAKCPACGCQLYYWDMVREPFGDYPAKIRLYCNNTSCSSYNNGLWFAGSVLYGYVDAHSHVEKY